MQVRLYYARLSEIGLSVITILWSILKMLLRSEIALIILHSKKKQTHGSRKVSHGERERIQQKNNNKNKLK